MKHPDPQAQMALAHATLARGAVFLGAGLRDADGDPARIDGSLATKVVGNGLRELDRFLNLLADEVALLAIGDRIDVITFARRRNTASKVAAIRRAMGLPDPDQERLLALGRTRDCLFYCAGIVRRPSHPGLRTMVAGWPPSEAGSDAPGLILQLGERLEVTAIDLARACEFYRDIADALVLSAQIHLRSIELSASMGYMNHAIVACDGL